MQLLHLKYYQLSHLTEKNGWVLLIEIAQEIQIKETNQQLIFESF